jgi:hypothetical protein
MKTPKKNEKTETKKKLTLKRESLRVLTPEELAQVAGGTSVGCSQASSYCCY